MIWTIFLTICFTSAFWWWILIETHFSYVDKLKERLDDLDKEYEWMDNEILEKRIYRKQKEKLIKELEKYNKFKEFVQLQAVENRIYKIYFYKNNKDGMIKIWELKSDK